MCANISVDPGGNGFSFSDFAEALTDKGKWIGIKGLYL